MTGTFRYPLIIIVFSFVLAALCPIAHGQTLRQSVSVDSVSAGDQFNFSVVLLKNTSYDRIIYPDSTYFKNNFELRKRQRFSVTDFKDSLSYGLQFWGVANDTLPSLPIKLVAAGDTTILHTKPVILSFRTVLKSQKEELRPLKPIFDFAARWWPYILGFILLLITAGLFYYFYKRNAGKPEPEAPPEFTPSPFLNPLKELENNLLQLKNITLSTKEHFKEYYINLGDAIRLYFEQLYTIPALESTSREIIYELNRRAIDERMIEQTRIVLREADMVKFAKFTPTETQAKQAYEKAEEFLAIAQELHGQRIMQMKRQHMAQIEQQRMEFQQQNSGAEA